MSELPINQVITGNCLDVMRQFPDGSIDLLPTDPPYNISNPTKIVRSGGKFGRARTINLDFGDWDHGVIEPKDWVPLAVEKLKPCGVFVSLYNKRYISHLCDLLEELGLTIRHVGGWHKQNPAPQARKVKWQNALELFVIATMNKGTGHHYNYEEGQHHDVITTPICQGNERLDHPTQKPLRMVDPIIRWWSFPGDIVLDPFCGTGTFLVKAKQLGRRYIGIDSSGEYCGMSRLRLSQTETPLTEWTK